jgi:hypothetical protein
MRTSSFFDFNEVGRISIARFAPRGMSTCLRFPALAPGAWFNKVSFARYRELYTTEVLAPLDPAETYKALQALAGDAEPILLCWERPPLTAKNWCHRRMVAAWFEAKLGIQVPEVETESRQLSLLGRGRR